MGGSEVDRVLRVEEVRVATERDGGVGVVEAAVPEVGVAEDEVLPRVELPGEEEVELLS